MKNFVKNFEEKFIKYKENVFNDISIISTIIDPRFKLEYFKELEHYETYKQKIENVFEIYKQKYPTTVITQISADSTNYKKLLFKRQKTDAPKSELSVYLEKQWEDESIDPLIWWNINKAQFPILSKLASHILSIPATSVRSEEIFSKSGNLITKKRSSLEKNTVKIIMLYNSYQNFLYI
jgi:hypothetical protein